MKANHQTSPAVRGAELLPANRGPKMVDSIDQLRLLATIERLQDSY